MRIANANKLHRKSGERSGEICGFFLIRLEKEIQIHRCSLKSLH
jgi:hypothetical protein